MAISKLKVLGTVMLVCVITLGGLQSFGLLVQGIRAANVAQDATTSGPDQVAGPVPGVDCVDRLDFGELHVDATAQAELAITFKGVQDQGVSVKLDVPDFVTVERLRVFRRGKEQPGHVYCTATLRLDTRSAGRRTARVTAWLGNQQVSVPVVATVNAQRRDGREPWLFPLDSEVHLIGPTIIVLGSSWFGRPSST